MVGTPSTKRTELSVKEKLDILKLYDKLPKMSQRSAAKHLKISQPLLCKILKSRMSIENIVRHNENTIRKRNRGGKDRQIESALKLWFCGLQARKVSINRKMLREKANELAKDMGKHFVATDGWLTRWIKRENIVYDRKVCLDKQKSGVHSFENPSKDHKSWEGLSTSEFCQVVIKTDELSEDLKNESSGWVIAKSDNFKSEAPTEVESSVKLETKNEDSWQGLVKAENETLGNPPTDDDMLEALKILARGVRFRTTELEIHIKYERFIYQLLKKS